MKVNLLHRPNFISLLLAFLFVNGGFVLAEEKSSHVSEFLNTKYKDKTNRQWLNYFLPFFAPTEAQLKEQLKNDPNWASFYASEVSEQQAPLSIQNLPSVSEKSSVPREPVKPEGALIAVRIPKGMSFPPSTTASDKSLTETNTVNPPVLNRSQVISNAKPVVIGPSPVIPKDVASPSAPSVSEKPAYIGIWTGQYSKLIEYYDPNSKSWKISENSLRDVPVELKLDEKGLLIYKMPQREGRASYVFKDEIFSIVCEDVRVRGDYSVEQENPQNLLLKTSRELVKDKMRVSLEFELLLKQ